jgi:hypothetical protein
MNAITEERPIFENEEWLVTESGLEHKNTGYFIERESLANRRDDGLWSWPLHMAEKSWCSMQLFAEAFSCAASVYDVRTGAELAQTFKMARCEIAPWPRAQKHVRNPAPLMADALYPEDANPILWKSRSSEKPARFQAPKSSDDDRRMRPQTGARPFSTTVRPRPPHLKKAGASALPWRAPRRFGKTGTKLVRLIQAAWNIR